MNQMNRTWEKSRGIRGVLVFILLFLCSCSAVQHFFSASGTDVLLADTPFGVTDLKSGTLMTLAESKPISGNQLKINFSKEENKTEEKTTQLVAAKFSDELRFIDFLIPGVNDKPQLSFESTARGLVFINPLFLGLPFEARVSVFEDIPKHPRFEALKQKVALSKSLSESSLIETEMEIAIDIAKQKKILISPETTSNLNSDSNNSLNQNQDFLQKNLFWLIEPANAQEPTELNATGLQYKITKQFEHDFEFNGYPYHHGYELKATPDGIKIEGGSILAQQVIVIPKSKVKLQGITNDDYGGKKLLDQDIVAELLLQPQPVGVWDGTVFTTAAGGSRTEQMIEPRSNQRWQHGDYVVLISAGVKLNRKNDKQPYGALEINIANEVTDILTLAGGTLLAESVSNVGAIVSDCVLSNDLGEILSCVQKQDNRFKIAGAFGVENEDVIQKFFTMLNQRVNWLAQAKILGKEQAKILGKSISVLDRGISLSRNTALGAYLSRENTTGSFYSAEISVIDPVVLAMAPKSIDLKCSREKQELLDMEFELGDGLYCPGTLTVKNYSNYAVELESKDADSFLVRPNNVESDLQRFRFYGLVDRVKIGEMLGFGSIYKYPLTVKRLGTRSPEKDITFNCDDTNLPVKWGLKITPKCTETGTYAEYENYANYPLELFFGNDVFPLGAKGRSEFARPESGTLRSSSRTVTIKIQANLN